MAKPAIRWQDALPGGNGRIGALVYGNIQEDTILINHEELWYGGITQDLPDLSQHLPELRSLLETGNYSEADRFFPDLMKKAGYRTRTSMFQPGFDLKVRLAPSAAFTHYRRELDMETGEITVTWKEQEACLSKRLFVSRPDDLVVLSVRSTLPAGLHADFQLTVHHPEEAAAKGFEEHCLAKEDSVSVWAVKADEGLEYSAAARIVRWGGTGRAQDGRSVVDAAEEVLVLVKVNPKRGGADACERSLGELYGTEADYERPLARHIPAHRGLFLSAGIDLEASAESRAATNEWSLLDAYSGAVPTALIERMYDYGRYLLISSSRPGGLPANLQGIWNGDYTPAWSGAFFNNENIQMNYWQALTGHMAETSLPFFDFFDSLLPDMRRNAQAFYRRRGILSPLFASPESGLKKNLQPHVVYWTAGAGWLAQHYYDYWLFTGDRTFLERRALPFLKECALFYEDFFVEGPDGKSISYPSNSPENRANGAFEGDGGVSVCINATMDFAVAREVLTNLCRACEELAAEQESLPRWRAMLGKPPDYQINEDGAIREWMHPDFEDNYHHRHLSHIYGLFPGFEITAESSPRLFEACRIAVEKRLVIGLGQQTGWSLAHMANIYARLGDGNRALECLELLSRSCLGDNLFTYHNDWRKQGITMSPGKSVFQIDANLGWTAAVQEMLLFSAPGLIKLLPALPDSWVCGSFQHFQCRGGVDVSMEWDMSRHSASVTLASHHEQELEIGFPWR
ncbi:glycoside hydrolase family 95 protein [Paenibacillus sp. P26]|nr:glycoside hydrolase family 95 protein [Paenibacillus sp. P26]